MRRIRPIAMLLTLLLALSACGAGMAAESMAVSAKPLETAQPAKPPPQSP